MGIVLASKGSGPCEKFACLYAQADRTDEAARAVANVRRLHPFFKVEDFGNAFLKASDRLSLRNDLRKAGLK